MLVHKDAKVAPGEPGHFLALATFEGSSSHTKEKVRADLASRFGPPLTDAKLARVYHCEAPRCELFRAAECTLVQADWRPAVPDLQWPEHAKFDRSALQVRRRT